MAKVESSPCWHYRSEREKNGIIIVRPKDLYIARKIIKQISTIALLVIYVLDCTIVLAFIYPG